MPIQCDWMVLCQHVVEDSLTQRLTLQGCLESVSVYDFPAFYPNFSFAASFSREIAAASEEEWEFALLRSSKTEAEQEIVRTVACWSEGTQRLRVFVNFAVLRITTPNTLCFRLSWNQVGHARRRHGPEVPLHINLIDLPEEQCSQLRALNIHYVPT